MPTFGSKATRRAAALVVASAAVALTAACGGGDSGDASANGQNARGGNTAFTAYIECMSKNGVTIAMPSGGPREGASGFPRPDVSGFPRPSGSAGAGGFRGGGFNQKPDGVDDATWQKAQEACASVRPTGRPGGGQGNNGQGNNDQGSNGRNAAYQNCLKDNGVADPATLDPSNATVKKAMETCKVLAPAATPSATPTA
ncbi:hypothetical protein [Actinoplanes sp. NPDC048796]|uniref:hypothetical protein n=1 Tax=Actinoplanes sp. NPDC048796 TaxID=3155640 RepID=UPI0033C3AB6E